MNRRGFLSSILVAAAAPAIVRADSLMRIVPRDLVLYGDGVHDDTDALQAWFDGKRVMREYGGRVGETLFNERFLITRTVQIRKSVSGLIIYGCHFRGEAIEFPA